VRHRVLPSVILAIVALALTVAITVGWNIIFATHYGAAFTAADGTWAKTGYWTLMALGDLFLATVITAISIFLAVMVRRSQRLHLQDAFIDRITHELRTPIAALRLSVDTCVRHQLDAPSMRQQLQDMRGDLDRLQDLVDHVIDAGRIEHGEWRPTDERIDLAALAESCCQRVRLRYRLAATGMRYWCDPALGPIQGDRVAIEHILVNLLDNAVKYSDEEPAVELRIRPDGPEVVITVSDRGIGIPTKEATRIFRRFHRSSAGRHRPGTGLGLYVVSQLCRQMGGGIHASPNRDATGTVFTVRLPREGHRVS
jgi:signal transduction histidine kinase